LALSRDIDARAPRGRRAARPPLSAGILLTPGFTLLAFSGFVDALRLAADEGDGSRPLHCSWEVLSRDRRPIRSSSGVAVDPTSELRDPRDFDYVVVVGGLLRDRPKMPAYIEEYLRRAAAFRIPLIGICTGSFVLARAGLMTARRCCVSWFHHRDFAQEFPGIPVVSDRLYLLDRDRITCAGGTGAIHLASHLIDRHCGNGRARKGLRIMIEDHQRHAATPQPQPAADRLPATSHPTVRRAMLVLERSITQPPSIAELAARAHTSVRNLERLFATELGMSPRTLLMSLQIDAARRLVTESALPLRQIAELCGFRYAAHFSRRFREAFAETPRDARRRFQVSRSRASAARCSTAPSDPFS
jgi:transcriptional regulator GlxA family with amidase domain